MKNLIQYTSGDTSLLGAQREGGWHLAVYSPPICQLMTCNMSLHGANRGGGGGRYCKSLVVTI